MLETEVEFWNKMAGLSGNGSTAGIKKALEAPNVGNLAPSLIRACEVLPQCYNV